MKKLNLDEIKGIELSLLIEFDKLCKKNGLYYTLCGGTLLGAVRHGGFIPWDDDIDVYMPFEDYIFLLRNFPEDDKYAILNWRLQDDCAMTFSKIIDCDTYLIHDRWFPYLYVMGCYIDIFPLGGYPGEESSIRQKWEYDERMDAKWNYYYLMKNMKDREDCREEIVGKKFSISFDSAYMVGAMHRIMQKRWAVNRRVFSETIKIKFEDDEFSAPIGYDEYLKTRYGDYMKIPSKEKRIAHSFYTYQII